MGDVIQMSERVSDDGERIEPPRPQGAMVRAERFRQSGPFGDLEASRLTTILQQAELGNIAQWAMLCDFIRGSDDTVAGLLETRRLRVRQAEIKIVPGRKNANADDTLAAQLVADALDRIEDRDGAIDHILLGQSDGTSYTEILWGYDAATDTVWPTALVPVHLRRFRFDEHWKSRLYDNGQNPGPDGYGEILEPNGKWIIYQHSAGAVYPGQFGIMRSIAWRWLFLRWAHRFAIEFLDRFGQPYIWARVQKNTSGSTRDDVRESLERLTAEHVAVFEEGGEIVIEAAGAAAGSDHYDTYIANASSAIATRILGTSDASAPGKNGSNAAVEARVDAVVDPRTRADAAELWSTLRRDLFRWILIKNAHKFTGTPAIPEAKLIQDVGVETDVQASALNGAQVSSLVDVIAQASAGLIPVSAARAIVAAANPTLPPEALDAMFADVAPRPAAPVAPVVDTRSGMA